MKVDDRHTLTITAASKVDPIVKTTCRQIKVSIHTAVYRWAKPLVAGKVILDAGCGTAYGTAILADVAQRVVAVDIDARAIEQASNDYPGSNIEYHVMDCHTLDFPADFFDVVFSNAMIELLVDYDAVLDEALRVLKPGGLFVCSTKNFNLSFKKSDCTPLYGEHMHEFTASQLRAELEYRYNDVHLYGEKMRSRAETYMMDRRASTIEHVLIKLNVKHRIPLAWRNFIRRLMTGVDMEQITPDDFEVVPGEFADCWYVVSRGSKGEL